jgi:hypothetical protein
VRFRSDDFTAMLEPDGDGFVVPYPGALPLRLRSRAQPLFERMVTVSPASFPIVLRTSALTGSLCVPSPMAMKELRIGCPSIVPRTFTRPRVLKYSTDSGAHRGVQMPTR